MVVPMTSGGELIGALSFGGAKGSEFALEQIRIAQEVATQLAIVIMQARLHDRVKRHADELERRVEERTEQLLAVNRELEAFSYSVSHDLRAPLRGIDDAVGQLAADGAATSDPQSRRQVERIRSSARRMGELTEDLLQLAAAGRGQLRREEVDLSRLVHEIVADLRERDPERDVVAEVEDHLRAQADRRLARIALENLLGNAWKFTSKTPQARIAFGLEARDGSSAYFVRDNGAGFDMAYAAKLFHPFQRLHGETEFSGSGIGLATVHRIVARHEGRIWAESAVDRGATFFFTLGPN
jgi:light-regulated signal transduction histidine kinase (bacteriophytochrome)